MQVLYTGQTLSDNDFIGQALISGDTFDPNIVSATSTQLVISNPSNGWVTTVNGSGFSFNANQEATGGTITSFTVTDGTNTIAEVSAVNWGLVDFVSAMDQAVDNDNFTPLATLVNQSQSISIDGSMSSGGVAVYDMLNDALYQVTSQMQITGSEERDTVIGGNGDDYINPGSNQDAGDHIYGSLGNDTIDFADANDRSWFLAGYGEFDDVTFNLGFGGQGGTITTSGFTDTLVNTDNTDWGMTLAGGSGSDTFNVTNGGDIWLWRGLQGGVGSDTYNITADNGSTRIDFLWDWDLGQATQGVNVNVGAGVASNDGFGFSDTINVTYGGGRLSLAGSNFDDVMVGGAGRDEFITRQGDDTVNGGAGFDMLRYDRNGVDSVVVDMYEGTATGVWHGQAFSDTFTSIEHVRGSRNGDDMLFGNTGGEYIQGRGGNDTIHGRGGNDTIYGEDGNDAVLGGFGFDTIYGGNGDDTLNGGENTDEIHGGFGNDRLVGGVGFDVMYGDGGNDTLFGGTEADRLFGGTEGDLIYGGANFGLSADRLFGEEGNDTLYGDAGYDRIDGGEGDDYLDGGAQADNLFGGAGNDTLLGSGGLDRLFSGDGDDLASGGEGTDGLFGDAGNDTLNGNEGNDRFFGGSGNDLIFGGADNDTINGGAGFDTIDGGTGDDLLFGRFNADTFVFADGHGNDTIADFTAGNRFEKIDLSGVSAITTLGDLDLASDTNGAATQVGLDVQIDTGGGNLITLLNVDLSELGQTSFIF